MKNSEIGRKRERWRESKEGKTSGETVQIQMLTRGEHCGTQRRTESTWITSQRVTSWKTAIHIHGWIPNVSCSQEDAE